MHPAKKKGRTAVAVLRSEAVKELVQFVCPGCSRTLRPHALLQVKPALSCEAVPTVDPEGFMFIRLSQGVTTLT
jgi:hypothetical protein